MNKSFIQENKYPEITDYKIEEVLESYNLTIQKIHNQIIDLQHNASLGNDMLESLAYPKNNFGEEAVVSSPVDDKLYKLYEIYEKTLKHDLKEVLNRMILLQKEYEVVHRIWICSMMLPEPHNTIVHRLYKLGEKRVTVARELDYSEKSISRIRGDAIKLIRGLYMSKASNHELMAKHITDSVRAEKMTSAKDSTQITIDDYINNLLKEK